MPQKNVHGYSIYLYEPELKHSRRGSSVRFCFLSLLLSFSTGYSPPVSVCKYNLKKMILSLYISKPKLTNNRQGSTSTNNKQKYIYLLIQAKSSTAMHVGRENVVGPPPPPRNTYFLLWFSAVHFFSRRPARLAEPAGHLIDPLAQGLYALAGVHRNPQDLATSREQM